MNHAKDIDKSFDSHTKHLDHDIVNEYNVMCNIQRLDSYELAKKKIIDNRTWNCVGLFVLFIPVTFVHIKQMQNMY